MSSATAGEAVGAAARDGGRPSVAMGDNERLSIAVEDDGRPSVVAGDRVP